MNLPKWRDIFPAVTTKFKENKDRDPLAMEKHFVFQIDAGVLGMVTGGSLGEASTLSFEEKLKTSSCEIRKSYVHLRSIYQRRMARLPKNTREY